MVEELYEQHGGQFDQEGELAVEYLICAVRDAVADLPPEDKRHLRSFVSSRRPPARHQQLTSAQEEMQAARDSAAHLIAFALSDGCRALVGFPPFETANSNENDNEQVPEVKNEANSEQDQAGLPIVSNTASTLTRRLTRDFAAGNVNYAGARENSLTDPQQDTLTGTRKRKRSIRQGKSTAHKRTRVVAAPTVAAAEESDENEDDDFEPETASESEEEDDPEAETVPLRIIIRRLKCRVPGCKKVFPGKVQLDGHLLTKHAIEKYACKVKDCTQSYATRDELKAHRDSAHDNLAHDNKWPCGRCETTCPSYKQLREHIYFYHEYGLFACSADRCDFTEKTRIKVQSHQQTHRPAKYRCTFAGCSFSFNKSSHLTLHLRTHTKEQPFLCTQCPKAFSTKSNLTVHERVHSGLKPYSCTWPHCDYSAKAQSAIIYHVRGVHFGLPQTKTEQARRGIIDDRDAKVFIKKTATNGN